MYFGQYLGLQSYWILYIYIYTYIAKIFYSTRQNETTLVYNIDYLDFEGLAPLSKKKR